jgi:hypothetical protein
LVKTEKWKKMTVTWEIIWTKAGLGRNDICNMPK